MRWRLVGHVALAACAAVLLAWHWSGLCAWLLRPLYVAADLLWPDLIPAGLVRVDAVAQGWRVHTGWPIADASGQAGPYRAIFYVAFSTLNGAFRGLGILLVLALATPRMRFQRLVAAELSLWAAAGIGLTLQAFVMAMVLQFGPQIHDFSVEFGADYRLAMPAPPLWQVMLGVAAARAYWLGFQWVVPLALWWWICPEAARWLWARVARRIKPAQSPPPPR